jgi:hypothetical protein
MRFIPGPLLLILILLAGPALAQTNRTGGDGDDSYALGQTARLPPVATLREGSAPWRDLGPRVVQALADAQAFCGSLRDTSYRIDCLAERLDHIAGLMPLNGPYVETRQTLLAAAKKLRGVGATYADPSRPALRVKAGGSRPQSTSRPIVPIRPNAAAAANRAASAILTETETILLRSSAGNPEVAQQVRSIAAAVGSNKVLLRSA